MISRNDYYINKTHLIVKTHFLEEKFLVWCDYGFMIKRPMGRKLLKVQ
jgi:hypothetical protein